ncbi:MAG: hypothetical protein M1831_000085 [Alyxoria varia]|nr:MAG: hypothetical protein M1831_000085 [Alyxoria varia]
MGSRYNRPPSPTGRRFDNYGRSSTSGLSRGYDMPSSYTPRDSYTSPRSSGERVIPLSSETYVNGTRVNSNRNRLGHDNYTDRQRRSTYAEDSAGSRGYPASTSASTSSTRPAVIQNSTERSAQPTKSSTYDNAYISSSASGGRREHKKVYSIDDGRTSRLIPEKDGKRRDEPEPGRQSTSTAASSSRRDYPAAPASRSIDDYGSYEYTDARGMFRDTEPKWRPRHGSFESSRSRPSSMIEPYTNPRSSARELGPPPATRALDKISRHDSLRNNVQSPPRSRDRSYGSFSEDDNYRVAPRLNIRQDPLYIPDRGEVASPTREDLDDRREPRALTAKAWEDNDVSTRGFGLRTSFDERDENRTTSLDRRSYPEDTVAQSGRREHPPEPLRNDVRRDVEPRDADRYKDYEKEALLVKERDTPRTSDRDLPVRDKDYAPKEKDYPPREKDYAPRDKDYPPRDKDYLPREKEYPPREREYPLREKDYALREKDLPRDPPPREREFVPRDRDPSSSDWELPTRERDQLLKDREPVPRERDLPPRDSQLHDEKFEPREREYVPRERDNARDRERDIDRSREYDRRPREEDHPRDRDNDLLEDDRRYRDRRPATDYHDVPEDKVHGEHGDARESQSHHGAAIGAGVLGTAAAGVAAYSVKEAYDRRRPEEDERRDEREAKDRRYPEDRRSEDPYVDDRGTGGREKPRQLEDRRKEDPFADDRDIGGREKPRQLEGSPEGRNARSRTYVEKDNIDDVDEAREQPKQQKHSETLDPDEEYRRRVQQEAERTSKSNRYLPADLREDDSDRERRRDDRQDKSLRDRYDGERNGRRDGHESGSDHVDDSQALTRYESQAMTDDLMSDEPSTVESRAGRENRVRIVEPSKEKDKPRGILRKPTDKFPEDPNPIREGVAPLKDAKDKDAPPGARWTKILRKYVNPEALNEAQERFEERQDHVIVLRVLNKADVQKYADRTKEIRDERYEKYERERERRDRRPRRESGRYDYDWNAEPGRNPEETEPKQLTY